MWLQCRRRRVRGPGHKYLEYILPLVPPFLLPFGLLATSGAPLHGGLDVHVVAPASSLYVQLIHVHGRGAPADVAIAAATTGTRLALPKPYKIACPLITSNNTATQQLLYFSLA